MVEDGFESETVNTALSPSLGAASPIEIVGALSSSVIDPAPKPSPIEAFSDAFESATVKVSFGSSIASAKVARVIVCAVEPAGKVTVPLRWAGVVKSAADDEPGVVAESTVTCVEDGLE